MIIAVSNVKLLMVFSALTILTGCIHDVDKKVPRSQTYILYREVEEVYDSSTEKVKAFRYSDQQPSPSEVKEVIAILEKYKFAYKVTNDSDLLISGKNISNIDDLILVNSEYARLHAKE